MKAEHLTFQTDEGQEVHRLIFDCETEAEEELLRQFASTTRDRDGIAAQLTGAIRSGDQPNTHYVMLKLPNTL